MVMAAGLWEVTKHVAKIQPLLINNLPSYKRTLNSWNIIELLQKILSTKFYLLIVQTFRKNSSL